MSQPSLPIRVYTTAPTDYDWGWTTVLIENVAVTNKGKPIRLVEIDDRYHADQQIGRYGSGMHGSWEPQKFEEELEAGYVTLTPEAEIHHRRIEFRAENFLSDATDKQLLGFREMIDTVEAMEGVKVITLRGGYDHDVYIFGQKSQCDRKTIEICGRFYQATLTPTN